MKKEFIIIIFVLLVLIIENIICVREQFDPDSPTSRICVIQYDDRELPENLQHLQKLNESYCKTHNIDYHFSNVNSNKAPPYWVKVFISESMLPKYDYVIWLDTDATLINIENLEKFITQHIDSNDVLISSDMPPWDEGKFNAGVFIFKNTTVGNEILKYWLSLYDAKSWKLIDGKWNCIIKDDCNWAGINYEQGSFINKVYPKYKDNITLVSWEILNNPYYDKDASAIFHFAGHHKENILDMNIGETNQ